MGVIPSSMVTAVSGSVAAGKNPWLPLALVFLLAAPESVPTWMMDPALHAQLHGFGPEAALWSLGGVLLVLALADSLADKIGFIEKWLVPVSTAWRPFAGVALATIVGVAAAQATTEESTTLAMHDALVSTVQADLLLGGSVVALTIAVGALAGWIATVSKTGIRLLLKLVPVPGLRFAHSLLDDLLGVGASVAGLVFRDSTLLLVLLGIYLAFGLVTAPILTRLAWIHMKSGWDLMRKGANKIGPAVPRGAAPKWVQKWLAANASAESVAVPAYVYRAPEVGWCRSGYFVLAPKRVVFLTRVWFRARAYTIEQSSLARVGLAETATSRIVKLVERLGTGALREVDVVLFPAGQDEVLRSLFEGTWRSGLVRVRSDSESARRGLPGFGGRSSRYAPADEAGSLTLQGTITIAAAIVCGVLTGGVFVPIGTGYLFSPYKLRFLFGWLISGYLSLCVVASMGFGWPAAVLYATLLNVVALRDLTRNALKARVDGYVDRRAWLPAVAGRVWVPESRLASESDRHQEGDPELLTDGTWRAVGRVLAAEMPAEPLATAA
jgi:hypothetical protein